MTQYRILVAAVLAIVFFACSPAALASGHSSTAGKSQRSSKSAKSGKSGVTARSGKAGKSQRSRKSGKSGKSGVTARSGKTGKSQRSHKSGKSGKSGVYAKSGKSGAAAGSHTSCGCAAPKSAPGAAGRPDGYVLMYVAHSRVQYIAGMLHLGQTRWVLRSEVEQHRLLGDMPAPQGIGVGVVAHWWT